MCNVRAWIYLLLAICVSFQQSKAHPQCVDGSPPFDAGTEFNFCPEYSHFGCCSSLDEVKQSVRYNDLASIVPSESWSACSSYLKSFLCQSCSPYASHLFDFKLDEVDQNFIHRLLPGLCPEYCRAFVDDCGQILQIYADFMAENDPELTVDASVLKEALKNRKEVFCNATSLDDPGYCFPDILEEKTSSIEAVTSDGCLCVQKMGEKPLKDVLILTHANDDSNRIFVVEESGMGHIMYPNGDFYPEPFFDISTIAAEFIGQFGKEPGALSMVFHPKFKENGLFYLYFTKSVNETTKERINRLAELKVLDSDKNKADGEYFRHILDVVQQSYDHHGGQILFGADGYLYLFTGDGGLRGDPFRNSQNLESLLGKALRIDVDNYSDENPYSIPPDNPFLEPLKDGTVPKPEIYAYGFRNPWRCGIDSGDPETGAGKGRILCGDVGQSKIEEVDVLQKGANYGWVNWEGSNRYCFRCKQGIESKPVTYPVFEYNRTYGSSVIGGHFYRGCRLSNMDGAFIFGDFTTGILFRLLETSPGVWEDKILTMCGSDLCHGPYSNDYAQHIFSFGQDQQGEIYILSSHHDTTDGSTGYIYKLIEPITNNCKTSEEDTARSNFDKTVNKRPVNTNGSVKEAKLKPESPSVKEAKLKPESHEKTISGSDKNDQPIISGANKPLKSIKEPKTKSDSETTTDKIPNAPIGDSPQSNNSKAVVTDHRGVVKLLLQLFRLMRYRLSSDGERTDSLNESKTVLAKLLPDSSQSEQNGFDKAETGLQQQTKAENKKDKTEKDVKTKFNEEENEITKNELAIMEDEEIEEEEADYIDDWNDDVDEGEDEDI